MIDVKPLYITIWNKTTTIQIFDVRHLFYNTVENLWYMCNIKKCIAILRGETSHKLYIYMFHITFHWSHDITGRTLVD